MNDSYESGVGNPWHWEPESSWSYYRPLPPYLESEYCNRVGVSPGSHGAEGFDIEVSFSCTLRVMSVLVINGRGFPFGLTSKSRAQTFTPPSEKMCIW